MSNTVLSYGNPPARLSVWAIAVFAGSIIAAVGFFLIIPAMIMFVASLIVRDFLGRRTDVSGRPLAAAAVAISGFSTLLGLCVLLTMGIGTHNRVSYGIGACLANSRGIVQSMNVYAASENDAFPIVSYAPYNPVFNKPAATVGSSNPDKMIEAYYRLPLPQAGSVQACVWILAAQGSVSTKQFICRDDPFAGDMAQTTDRAGNCYDNFQHSNQLSYSFAYPWKGDGTVGPWWRSESDASLPIVADMTPLQGTGKPPRNLVPGAAPPDPHTWNSANHNGEGQVVAFGDAHSEFLRNPDVGQDNDNIYSMSGLPSTRPAQYTGIPAGKAPPTLNATKPPFDIVMYPVRNETTAGY